MGYCYDGSEGVRCNEDSIVDGKTKSRFVWSKRLKAKNIGEDSKCEGYCEFGYCYDGSEGNKVSHCQSGLDCREEDEKIVCMKKAVQIGFSLVMVRVSPLRMTIFNCFHDAQSSNEII